MLGLVVATGLAMAGCATGSDSPESDPDGDDPIPTAENALGPRQIRLLTRREYDATVHDLLFAEAVSTPASECAALGDCSFREASCVGSVCVDDPCTLVTFVLPTGASTYGSVVVAGSFNGWAATADAGAWPMTYDASVGGWITKHEVPVGTYSYKLVANGSTWLSDPGNPNTEPDGFGGVNSVLTVVCDGTEDPGTTPSSSAPESFTGDFPVESRPEGFPFDDGAESGLVTSVHAEQYFRAAKRIAELATEDVAATIGCSPSDPSDPCIRTFLDRLTRRAYRRALDPAELDALVALAAAQTTTRDAVAIPMRVILQSPNFLYRSEVGVEAEDGAYRLEPWEVASLLSYTLWGSMPDDTLLDAATEGDLETAADYEREARRLLGDPRARDRMGLFALGWLGVESLKESEKAAAFPFDAELGDQMMGETRDLVASVLLDHRAFSDLFVADTTSAPERLATMYGADESGKLPEARRAGILAQGSVLATYAHSDQTSPVKRGMFVRRRLMCMELGTPPPNAGQVPEIDPGSTTRERFEQHSKDLTCYSCHQHIDPIGFGFEHFDPVGAWRDDEGGKPIDASGSLGYVNGWEDASPAIPFASLPELGSILAGSDQVRRCFVTQLRRFATGRLETEVDAPVIEDLLARFQAADDDALELLVALTQTHDFAMRK